jgi:hypothetical protein
VDVNSRMTVTDPEGRRFESTSTIESIIVGRRVHGTRGWSEVGEVTDRRKTSSDIIDESSRTWPETI